MSPRVQTADPKHQLTKLIVCVCVSSGESRVRPDSVSLTGRPFIFFPRPSITKAVFNAGFLGGKALRDDRSALHACGRHARRQPKAAGGRSN